MQEQTFSKPTQTQRIIIGLFTFTLIIVLAIAVATGWLWWRTSHQQQIMLAKTQDLQLMLAQNDRVIAQQAHQLTVMNTKLAQMSNHDNREWVLAEAEYLIRLAEFSLTFQSNVPVAVKLLTLADQHIKSLADPSMLPLRQALANDITTLNAIPDVDTTGLITKLNALSLEIAQLPVIPSQAISTQTADVMQQSMVKQQSLWHKFWANISQSLKNVVIIRRQTAITPLLSPQQQAYLIENVRLQIAQAQWAVLHQQPAIYQQSLIQAIQWLKDYFVQSSNSTQSVISALENLQTVTIKPTVPDLSVTLKLLPQSKTSIPHRAVMLPSQESIAL